MKKHQIAREIGVSPSAVSKAINHCAGLSTELREQILNEAAKQGLSGKSKAQYDAYVILPGTPMYFWERIIDLLFTAMRGRGITAKYNVYSKMGDRDTVERYLDEAERLQARVIIIAARHPGLDERLSRLAETRAVFSIVETTQASNVFFIGSDRRSDSRLLGSHCLREHPDTQRILLFGDHYDPERSLHFMQTVGDIAIHSLNLPPEESIPDIARQIDGIHREHPFDMAVCLDGRTAKISMALKKCRISVPLYGFEHPPIEERYQKPEGEVCQDLDGIVATAAEATERYLLDDRLPASKYTYVPSTYIGSEPK